MSTNPNKLAFKGTPGPWKATLNQTVISIHTGDTDQEKPIENGFYHDPTICGIWCDVDDNRRNEYESNAHLISAAPEAVEFIADLMPIFELMNERNLFNRKDVDKLIECAETILKKAYNQ